MNSSHLWKLFVETGRISAYLRYRNRVQEEEQAGHVSKRQQGG